MKSGAINKTTKKYQYPELADKKDKFICPDCSIPVRLRKGLVNKPHFAHIQSTNPCNYYEHIGESQIHKNGKSIIKSWLDTNTPIFFNRICSGCRENVKYKIGDECYDENTFAKIEHAFDHDDGTIRHADVALVKYKIMTHLFEVRHTHATKEEDRPKGLPWFDINAMDIINQVYENRIVLKCMRMIYCEYCMEQELQAKEERRRRDAYREWREQDEKRREKEWQLAHSWIGIMPIR